MKSIKKSAVVAAAIASVLSAHQAAAGQSLPPIITSTGGPYYFNIGSNFTLNGSAFSPSADPLILVWDVNNDGTSDLNGSNALVDTSIFFPTAKAGDSFVILFTATDAITKQFTQSKANIIAIAATQGAVPEPTTWALLIGGFGLAGAALRRHRSRGHLQADLSA